MLKKLPLVALLVTTIGASVAAATGAHTFQRDKTVHVSSSYTKIDAHLNEIRHSPERLRPFVFALPKGADIHTHLTGAVSTKKLIAFAEKDNLCIDTTSFVATLPPCQDGQRSAQDAKTDTSFYESILRAWSMWDFQPGEESGHDHFFATIPKFGPTSAYKGAMLAEIASRAAEQNEFYVEVMITRVAKEIAELARHVGFDGDLERMHNQLQAHSAMDQLVSKAREHTNLDFTDMRTELGCDSQKASPGCHIPVRIDYQVPRAQDPEIVFAHLLLGFKLAEVDPRYVGINLVQQEDHPIAIRDYRLHMKMIDYLHQRYPTAHIALHAGELTPQLVAAPHLRFHIREAVQTGHAQRIGHGVSILHEDNWQETLRTLARQHIVIEVPLTSNCQILEICDNTHPFALFRQHGVPVVLATDDEGIEHTDMTNEYMRAITTFDLHYGDLKHLARAALEHSFLPGRSLWNAPNNHTITPACAHTKLGSPHPQPTCQQLLNSSEKATAQWKQEAAFTEFEAHYT